LPLSANPSEVFVVQLPQWITHHPRRWNCLERLRACLILHEVPWAESRFDEDANLQDSEQSDFLSLPATSSTPVSGSTARTIPLPLRLLHYHTIIKWISRITQPVTRFGSKCELPSLTTSCEPHSAIGGLFFRLIEQSLVKNVAVASLWNARGFTWVVPKRERANRQHPCPNFGTIYCQT